MTKLSRRYKLMATLWTFPRTMFRQARLSNEHATLCLDFESVAMSVGTQLKGKGKTAVVAYANEVTIFVTAPQDINFIRDLLLT
jgi:hypothetical protein